MNTIQQRMTVLFATLVVAACMPAAPSRVAEPPPLTDMKLATPAHGKIGAPVDVHYQFSGVALKDSQATLQLAFVPRLAGGVMRVEFPASETVSIDAGDSPMFMQKAQAAATYRRTLTVTPRQSGGGHIQVIVSMDIADGRYFSVFTIPIASPIP
jgi:hypothetical protein